MYKNTASQKLIVYAYDTDADAAKTGDASNITCYISKDGGAAAQSNDANPTELDATNMKGLYAFDLTQAETNCDLFAASPVSSTSNIQIEPVVVYTTDLTAVQTANVTQWAGNSTIDNSNLDDILERIYQAAYRGTTADGSTYVSYLDNTGSESFRHTYDSNGSRTTT